MEANQLTSTAEGSEPLQKIFISPSHARRKILLRTGVSPKHLEIKLKSQFICVHLFLCVTFISCKNIILNKYIGLYQRFNTCNKFIPLVSETWLSNIHILCRCGKF